MCYKGKCQASMYALPVPDPMAWKQDTFHHPCYDFSHVPFPPFPLCSASPGLIKSSCFNKALIDSRDFVMASERVVHRSVSHLVEEPLEFPLLWNHLVQPHVQNFYRGLGTLRIHTRKLSGVLSKRQYFQEQLQRSLLQTSRIPQQLSTRVNGPDSSIGGVDRISLRARPLFSR